MPIEFIIFSITLIGIAFFHKHTLLIAFGGLITLIAYKFLFTSFPFTHHLIQEFPGLINILGLLLGFAILENYFDRSKVPHLLPDYLPDDWKGGFGLLLLVFISSAFLDNIAAAMLGGSIAKRVFNNRVHIAFIAAIVAASNAGGAGSVLGDTTTTMIWISGIPSSKVLLAYVAAIPAFILLAYFASKKQDAYQRITKDAPKKLHINYKALFITAGILLGALVSNVLFDMPFAGVWVVILLAAFIEKPEVKQVRKALPGSAFLICLVLSASFMPVENLPSATALSTFVLGTISAFFDNIPLTKLAIEQGGYHWGLLAYAVGFGGSMVWFGSSAGVAICNDFPQAKSVWLWLKNAWFIALAYVVGFVCLTLLNVFL